MPIATGKTSVARSGQAFTATCAKNHGRFRSFHGHISKYLVLHDILKHNNNKKLKYIMFGEGFCHFFIYALHYWSKHYTNFVNFTKFLTQHLIATHGHFHRHQFFTANYIFIRPVLSYLAVATATWQHWERLQSRCPTMVFSQEQIYFNVQLLKTN